MVEKWINWNGYEIGIECDGEYCSDGCVQMDVVNLESVSRLRCSLFPNEFLVHDQVGYLRVRNCLEAESRNGYTDF